MFPDGPTPYPAGNGYYDLNFPVFVPILNLNLNLKPMVVSIDESIAQPSSIIQMAESGETEETKQRFIITARALEGQQELEEDVEDVGNTLEPEEFIEEESSSIDYEAQVTDETEAPLSTSIDTTELPLTTISPPTNTTVNGLFTSTTVPAYTTERVSTTSKAENELVNSATLFINRIHIIDDYFLGE